MKRTKFLFLLCLVIGALISAGCSNISNPKFSSNETSTTEAGAGGGGSEGGGGGPSPEALAGKPVFEEKCTICHGWEEPGLLEAEGKNPGMKGQFTKHPKRDEWKDTVGRMKTNGMAATDEELGQITAYLNAVWGTKSPAPAAAGGGGGASDAAGKAVFEDKCTGCHGWEEPGLLEAKGKNPAMDGQFAKHPKRDDWKDTVGRMKTNGMAATDEELKQITDYLNATWSNKAPAAAPAAAEGGEAPAAGGAGKAVFEDKCTGCHGWEEPGLLEAKGKNPAMDGQFAKHPKRPDWTDTVGRMKTNGMAATDEELKQITDYLNEVWKG